MTDDDLRFAWLPTFANRPDDYCGWDGSTMLGRVFHSQYGWWHWHLSGPDKAIRSGQSSTEHDAKLALEAAYLERRIGR